MADVLENHLMIGLGGTGGKILRSFRKTIYQNFRSENPSNVNVRYLYVDSSDALMALDDPTWKILGTSVQLPQTSQLKISGLNLGEILDTVGDYPGIAPWIGNRDQLRAILKSADSASVVGGQKRRLGRFLFACRAQQFRSQVQALVKEMQTGGIANVTFHFLSGLAGGTGSGSLVDAVCQVRQMFPTPNYRNLIYALLPDKLPAANRAGANYHANGYAALLELNALDVGEYLPWDVSGTLKTRLDLQDSFNCCYLFTDENEDHNKVDIDTELPDIVAAFLFQKIVATRDFLWSTSDGDSIKRQERFELGSQADEKERAPASGKPERTRRFFTFGVKQIAYPEEEIREYLTYSFAQQAVLQLEYNNWTDAFGYVDQPVNTSFAEFVRNPEMELRWSIGDDALMLSTGVLPDEKKNSKWKPIQKYWLDIIPNFKSTVVEIAKGNQASWIDELMKMCETAYSDNYRDLGVQKFYEVKRGEIVDHVREIRRIIESDLFTDWKNGVRSISEVSQVIAALVKWLDEKAARFDERATKTSGLIKDAEQRVQSDARQWAAVGMVGKLLGRRQRLFDDEAVNLQQLYTYRTILQASSFAKSLLQSLSAAINDLAADVNAAASTISQAFAEFGKDLAARLVDDGDDDTRALVIRFYKPDVVKDFAKALTRNEDEQKVQTTAVRVALAALVADNLSFAVFNQRVDAQRFQDIVAATCEEQALQAHEAYISSNKDRERVLGVSIVERLQKEYGGNRESLRAYVTGIVSRAKNFIVFNPAEVTRVVPGNESLGPMFSFSTIILPEAANQAEFRKILEEEFVNARPGQKEIVTNPKRPNEITLINVTSAFPARDVQDVSFLRDKYDARVGATDGDQARFELHSEGDGTQFPSLFLRKIGPSEILPELLLASALSIVQTLEDPDTGRKGVYLMRNDAQGREAPPLSLGKSLTDAVDALDALSFDALETQIRGLLARDFLHQAKRAELLANVGAQVDAVKTERPNPLDKTRQAYIAAQARVEDLLKGN
ncbi:MAG: hypothetical protein JO036_00945 [Candidatus Eremiobacteraeota bacterium]|nr:hypothetical protein [Candidatus Eremiobacteraeota bacterium]